MNLADIFLKILNMSFTGAAAAVIILWVRLLYRMLPKKYLCILWCVVLLRLLCPFTFPEMGIGQPIQEPIPSNIMETAEPYIASEIEVIDNTVNNVLKESFTPSAEQQFKQSMSPLQQAMTIGAFVWTAGIVGMLTFTVWKLHHFYQWVREAVPDKELGQPIYRCAAAAPVVVGVIKPKIYLPFSLEEPQLAHVLTHEKMHIQRRDYLLKLLFYIAVIVHWFNPLVWLSYRLLERDMEMACDEAVLEKLGTEEKANYCESLLNLADSNNHFAGNPVAFGESDVKVRIKNVLNYRKPRLWLSAAAMVILLITAVRCLNGPKEVNSEPLTNESVETQPEPALVESRQLTMDVLLGAAETNTIEEVPWHQFPHKVNAFADGSTSAYYISCNMEYAGKELVLNCSFEKKEETLQWIIMTVKEDDSSIRIYDREMGGALQSKEEILQFAETDHNILNEIALELPEGLSFSTYHANVGFEGGCLILPMIYEGNEEAIPDSWMSAGMVSRFTQEWLLEWKGERIESFNHYDNYTLREVLEQVDGLCAPALLMSVEHDLYTAAAQAEMMEAGIELDFIENTSKYWYLILAEPGEKYGYVISLNQKNFEKEDILELGKTVSMIRR